MEFPRSETLRTLRSLKAGLPVPDSAFDSNFPAFHRALSGAHWTPVEAALIASRYACFKPGAKVLDVGSGVGKFCMLGSLFHPDSSFHGVEQRGTLVGIAKRVARKLAVPRATFAHANAENVDWSRFDSVYLFNPFWEHFDEKGRIDDAIPLHAEHFLRYLTMTREKLAQLRDGSRAVILNGFGAEMPPGFRLLASERVVGLDLHVWERFSGR